MVLLVAADIPLRRKLCNSTRVKSRDASGSRVGSSLSGFSIVVNGRKQFTRLLQISAASKPHIIAHVMPTPQLPSVGHTDRISPSPKREASFSAAKDRGELAEDCPPARHLCDLASTQLALTDRLRFLLAKNVRFVMASREDIQRAIVRHYGLPRAMSADSMLQDFEGSAIGVSPASAASTARATTRPKAKRGGRGVGRRRPDQALAPAATRARSLASVPRLRLTIDRRSGMFSAVEVGQRVLMTRRNGTKEVLVGPKRVWRWFRRFEPMSWSPRAGTILSHSNITPTGSTIWLPTRRQPAAPSRSATRSTMSSTAGTGQQSHCRRCMTKRSRPGQLRCIRHPFHDVKILQGSPGTCSPHPSVPAASPSRPWILK